MLRSWRPAASPPVFLVCWRGYYGPGSRQGRAGDGRRVRTGPRRLRGAGARRRYGDRDRCRAGRGAARRRGDRRRRGRVFTRRRIGTGVDRRSDRKSVGEGKSVSVRVDLGGRRLIKKKKNTHTNQK